jgi:membrane protease YdiL (CAAX protease family)
MTFLKRHTLAIFVAVTYALVWLAWCLLVSTNIPLTPLWIFGSWAPNIAVAVVLGLAGDRVGLRQAFSGFLKWKVGVQWYLVAIGLPLSLSLLTGGLYFLFGGNLVAGGPDVPALTAGTFLGSLLSNLVFGPLGEEAGWRGFALPRLQRRFNALVSSLILGAIWAPFHIPMWLADTGLEVVPFWAFSIAAIGLTILMTWLFNSTKGSLIIIALFHLFFNVSWQLVTITLGVPPAVYWQIGAGVVVACAVIAVALAGPAELSRKFDAQLASHDV